MTTLATLTRARKSLTVVARRAAGELLGNARASWTVLEAATREAGGIVAETAAELRGPKAATRPAAKAPPARKRRPAVRKRAALI